MKSSEKVQRAQEEVWGYLECIVNSILFFLLGAGFFSQALIEFITITLVVTGVVSLLLSRIIALGILSPSLRIEKEKSPARAFGCLIF
jgi:NhaP-type Na+/H+ or K+/H+ antiporter